MSYNSTVCLVIEKSIEVPKDLEVFNHTDVTETTEDFTYYLWNWVKWYGSDVDEFDDWIDKLEDKGLHSKFLLLIDGEEVQDVESRGDYHDCDFRIGIMIPKIRPALDNKAYKPYMETAWIQANRSSVKNTGVGVIIIDNEEKVVAVTRNKYIVPMELNDPRTEKPEAYNWIIHAEMDAIAHAARCGTSIQGSTMIVTHPPCIECAKAIVQSGIATVIAQEADEKFLSRWGESIEKSKQLFNIANINYYELPKPDPYSELLPNEIDDLK